MITPYVIVFRLSDSPQSVESLWPEALGMFFYSDRLDHYGNPWAIDLHGALPFRSKEEAEKVAFMEAIRKPNFHISVMSECEAWKKYDRPEWHPVTFPGRNGDPSCHTPQV